MSYRYEKNKTMHEEVVISCIKCIGRTTHKVMASMAEHFSDDDFGRGYESNTDYEIVQCLGCKSISFRRAHTNSEELVGYEDHVEHALFEDLYPARIDGVRGLADEIRYLPFLVSSIYLETLQALRNKSPVLTAIGFRVLVEAVCKEKEASGKYLSEKINSLAAKGVLTPNGAEILHKIRTLGNKAAHETSPHTEDQLSLAMGVIENLLENVYILPKQVAAKFGGKP